MQEVSDRHLRRPSHASAIVIALLLMAGAACAQPAAKAPASWSLETAVLNTAAQAWNLAGCNKEQYAAMIRSMAGLVASNRGLKIPDSKEVGQTIGQMVIRDAKADPDELLYVIVDHAVMFYIPPTREPMVPTALPQASEASLADALTETVLESWTASGCNIKNLQGTIDQMTALVLQNRGLTVPDTKEAGEKFGQILRTDMEAHPNDLLYSAVERSLRQVAVPATATK